MVTFEIKKKCPNCHLIFHQNRKSQKFCKRICSLEYRHKKTYVSQYKVDWRLESLKKKLNQISDKKIKNIFKISKKEILNSGYSSQINRKISKIIGIEKWRKSTKGKETLKKYNSSNKVKEKRRIYSQLDHVKEKQKKYQQSEKGKKVKRKSYLKQKAKPDYREKINLYVRNRKKIDPIFKMSVDLRRYINKTLRIHKKPKYHKLNEVLGCTIYDLKIYLQKKFKPGMTWDNHSVNGWHIDHIKPLSKFDLSNPNEQKKAFHYSNLQPLWAKENRKKYNKIY